MDLEDQVVELIRRNRISTTEIADALGKKGGVPGVIPLTSLKFAVGRIKFISVMNDSNYLLHKEIESVSPGEIIYIKPHNFSSVAVFGDLVAKYSLLYKQAAAIVVEGNVRDTARLVREQYPIWCHGSNPVGAVNSSSHSMENLNKVNLDNSIEGIAICDQGGVVVIPKSSINETLLRKLQHIEAQEDLWYFCLNSLHWSTYDIVVNKRYLTDRENIPEVLIKAVLDLGDEVND
jgi:4-hydroxy-4-methyl-2-oxoglutarate aldolase